MTKLRLPIKTRISPLSQQISGKYLNSAMIKFNRMWETISTDNHTSNKNLRHQYEIVYKYGVNLVKLFPSHLDIFTETLEKLHTIETMLSIPKETEPHRLKLFNLKKTFSY